MAAGVTDDRENPFGQIFVNNSNDEYGINITLTSRSASARSSSATEVGFSHTLISQKVIGHSAQGYGAGCQDISPMSDP